MKLKGDLYMKIGPIQEQWLQRLEQHPELQTNARLGELTEDGYRACCLGEYLLTYHRCLGTDISRLFNNGVLQDGDDYYVLVESFDDLGLQDDAAHIFGDCEYDSLAEMNDNGVSWPEIAAYIRKYPEMVFTKSI